MNSMNLTSLAQSMLYEHFTSIIYLEALIMISPVAVHIIMCHELVTSRLYHRSRNRGPPNIELMQFRRISECIASMGNNIINSDTD